MEVKPGYKQTEVGVIPEEWDVCNLADLSLKITDGDHLTPKRESSGYYLLSARNVIDGRIDVRNVDYVGLAEYQRMKQRCGPEAGDILISCSGTIGRVAVVPQGFECVLVHSAALAKINKSLANGVFLQFWLQGESAQSQISASVNQGAQPNLFLYQIERLKCPKPPLTEQLYIAKVLADLDELLSELDQLKTKKSQIKQAAMQELLTGKRRLPGFEGEWVAGKLGDYVEKIVGGGTPSRANPGFWGGEIPWATVKDLTSFQPNQTQEWLTRDGLKNSSANLIPAGTLIASTRMALGKAVIFGTDVAINQDLKAIFFGKNGMTRFFCYWFEANASAIDAIGGGSTVKGISLSQLKALDVASPGLAEQNAIVDVISDIETEIETLENRLSKTRAIKQAIMQELLTGRIRLR